MKRTFLAIILAGSVIIGAVAAHACGDKLLAFGRGVRFQRTYKAAHPASILAFDRENSTKNRAEVEKLMSSAGHRLEIVTTPEQLATATQAHSYDLVMTDVADAVVVESALESATSKPSVIVFVRNASKFEMAAATKRYRWALKSPTDMTQVFAAIDAAMAFRSRQSQTAQKN